MKIIFALVITILFLPFVQGGNTLYVDFSNSPIQTLTLNENDRIEFHLLQSTHTIVIDEVRPDHATLDIFVNLKNLSYASVSEKQRIQVDVNRDRTPDLSISYQGTKRNKVTLSFVDLTQPLNIPPTGKATSSGLTANILDPKNIEKAFPIVLILLALLGLTLFFSKIKNK